MRIFSIPFAGGSRYSYNHYLPYSKKLEWIPLELPGRGARIHEPLISEMREIVDDLYDQITQYNLFERYAFYGHSMGAVASWLLIQKIASNGLSMPFYFFASGRRGPSVGKERENIHDLPADQFFKKLRGMNGTPDEIFDNPEVLYFFEPIFRSDFKAIELFEYAHIKKINVPIATITGSDDCFNTQEKASFWQKETEYPVRTLDLPGNHFFIYNHPQTIVEFIERECSAAIGSESGCQGVGCVYNDAAGRCGINAQCYSCATQLKDLLALNDSKRVVQNTQIAS